MKKADIEIEKTDGEEKRERLLEEGHLRECLEAIKENIRLYEEKESQYRKEVTELFQAVKKGEGDSYGQLSASQSILEHTQNILRKNRAALKKAYFGRIDYEDKTFASMERRYIGKNGVTRNSDEVMIVDWRAPVASVYYENETGEGTYQVPGSGAIEIDLKKKRTYDIEGERILGFYDDDVAANDELLVKYLSQHKEAVLGDIIATIQKEQNEIIRDIPFKNIIVQGVAGSGKTTVALHRISFLLYNYEERYKPSEFCIVGSSDMLLNYIGSGLPELDVKSVSQMRMDKFLIYLLGRAWKKKWRMVPEDGMAAVKSKLNFARKLDRFLANWQDRYLDRTSIRDEELGVILSEEDIEGTLALNKGLSMMQLQKLLNSRLALRIRFLCTGMDETFRKEKLSKYRKYICLETYQWTERGIYEEFLKSEGEVFMETLSHVGKNEFDLYDTAALLLIHKRIFLKKPEEKFSQIIIDEAQDFGEMVYYAAKEMLPECYFTVMGDVSQNIRYETGMNDWEDLKELLFERERDSFYLLAKSYRNTIEISECAGRVLEKASQGSYRIQPVIRHGKAVETIIRRKEELAGVLLEIRRNLLDRGFETIAVICRYEEEAKEVKRLLGIAESGEEFHNGVMVLPVTLTKGLEFDAVILWKPDECHYGRNIKEAKLLYVAITRALHELYLVGEERESSLFGQAPSTHFLAGV